MNHSNFYPQQINTFKSQAGEFDAYKKSVKELLFFASDLSEGQKAISEFFDDKIKSVFESTLHIAHQKKLSPDEYSQLDLTTKLAAFDALIVVWQLKTRWDAVRPFSAIPFAMQVRYFSKNSSNQSTKKISGTKGISWILAKREKSGVRVQIFHK